MIYVALVHHPVVNRQGERIVAAVTNLDIHDIARAARTYGVTGYFLVTPVAAQRAMAMGLVDHWIHGVGGQINPDRREALELVSIVGDLNEVRDRVALQTGGRPRFYGTTARHWPNGLSWEVLRKELANNDGGSVLLFGTASGLEDSVLARVDGVLAPIECGRPYNHLSVRSAVAIALDRLLGARN